MFDFIKSFQQRRIIKNLMATPREKTIRNIQDVQNIGILFTVGSEPDWNIIYHFVKIMEKSQKRIHLIGYQENGTELSFIISHTQTIVCHEKADFDFWGVPNEALCGDFINQHFDLLIDTTDEKNFFTRYIVLKTAADLKVTYLNANEQDEDDADIYDLIINGNGPLNMKDYFNNVVNTLNMIQK